VTIELLSKSPIEPFNEDFTTLDKGLRVVIERGDLVGPITFGIAVGSLSDHENAIGSLVFGSEFIPAPITPNQQTQIIEIRHNFSQSLSVPQPILAPRDIKKTAVGSSVLGILKEFLVFSVTGDLQINEQLVAQFDGQNWGEVDPSLLTGLEGKTVIIAVHGIRSNLQDTFPSSCARKLANTKPGNTVLLGFQYDFNTSISTNMDAFASFLRQLRSNNPTIKVHIVAHSMGTLVSSGAIFNGNLDSTMFASFFPISGMATGTPSADAAPGFVTDLLNTKMGKTISPVGQVAGTITIGHLFDALPEGIGQMGREPLDFVPLFLRGRSSTDIPVVVAYGNPDDRVVPSDSWSSWAEYFPNATTKVKGSGHSIVCGRDGNADEVINDIVTIISTPPPPPPTLPTITITATDLTATEAGPTPGTFTVSRTGSTSSPLTILYSVSGSATAGSDYNELSSSVIIPAGFSTATITVVPIDETIVESDETVVVTLTLNAAYTVGSLSSAIVTITDNDFLLTVSTGAGTGSGGVTSTDGKINCPGDCTEGYNSGTVVTLTATPNAGSTFAGWSGVCAGTGSCVVTMDGNKTVTATFNLSAGGGGTVTPGNVTLGTAGSCTGGALTTTFQVSAASNVTWTASGDPQTPPLGGGTLKVAPGSGSGSGSLVVTITVPPQLPSSSFSNCSLTYNLGTFSNVFVTFSDGSVIGVTVYWTFVGVT
jgi:pimeloyl-ACP methyl ester carboxylesterase